MWRAADRQTQYLLAALSWFLVHRLWFILPNFGHLARIICDVSNRSAFLVTVYGEEQAPPNGDSTLSPVFHGIREWGAPDVDIQATCLKWGGMNPVKNWTHSDLASVRSFCWAQFTSSLVRASSKPISIEEMYTSFKKRGARSIYVLNTYTYREVFHVTQPSSTSLSCHFKSQVQ